MSKKISGLKSSDFRPLRINMQLFPFDCAHGLRRQIQQNAVNAFDLMGNTVGDLVQNTVGNFFDGSRHGILGVDGADDSGPAFVAALVLDTDALDVGHSDEVLPDLFVQAVLLKLFPQDSVCFTQSMKTVAGNSAQAADTQAGAREGLTVDHAVRQAQSLADDADFVLKEQLDRLDQLELKILRQTAHIVVRLDSLLA